MQDDSDLDVPAELFHRAEAIMARRSWRRPAQMVTGKFERKGHAPV
jgi:hypothetical protein